MTAMNPTTLCRRIIIIEDEPVIALDIEQAVVESNCIVAGMAHTLEDALVLLDKTLCDGVILDANLGGKNARPIIDRLKAENIPFLIVSGYTYDQLELLKGSVPLVAKPFDFKELTASIREHLLVKRS